MEKQISLKTAISIVDTAMQSRGVDVKQAWELVQLWLEQCDKLNDGPSAKVHILSDGKKVIVTSRS